MSMDKMMTGAALANAADALRQGAGAAADTAKFQAVATFGFLYELANRYATPDREFNPDTQLMETKPETEENAKWAAVRADCEVVLFYFTRGIANGVRHQLAEEQARAKAKPSGGPSLVK